MKYDIVSVGILVADVHVGAVKEIPEKGRLLNVGGIEIHSGGNAMTASINAAKLGLKPALIGMVGNDRFGKYLLDCLDENDVAKEGVSETNKAQTSASVVLCDTNGERSFLHVKGANNIFDIDNIDFDVVKNGKLIFVTGSLLMKSFDGRSTVDFLKKCKEAEKITALDMCWDPTVDCSWIMNDAMKYIDIFMPSIDEAKMLSGSEDLEIMAEMFMDSGAKKVVIKCGADGCYIKDSLTEKGRMIPAYKAEKVVDTTGAGDSFCSGFLSAYIKGMTFEDCARFGNAVGACCVAAQGATSGTRSFEETLKMIRE